MLRPPPARVPPALVRPDRIRAPPRFAARPAAPPPARCPSRRRMLFSGRILPPPTVHCWPPALVVPVGSGTGPECSTPPPAPGRTRSGSIHSIRTPLQPPRPLAGFAGAVLRKLVLHSCPYFITKFVTRTDGLL